MITLEQTQGISAFVFSIALTLLIVIQTRKRKRRIPAHCIYDICVCFICGWSLPLGLDLWSNALSSAFAASVTPIQPYPQLAALGGLVLSLTSLITLARLFKKWLR